MLAQVVFLEKKEPLARQVAEVILEGRNALPIDLGDTQVWVPTAGAGRRIREALATVAAERNTGVLSPVFLQPMQALLPVDEKIATRSEREAAWVAVLREKNAEEWVALLPDPTVIDSATGALGIAGMFCDLCDLLAEGGLSPAHSLLGKVCSEDGERWQQIQPLYLAYRECLAKEDLHDPNELRVQSQPYPGIRRIVVACIPDLAEVAARFLNGLAKNGVAVSILIWKPTDLPGGWDAWGRPLPEEWAKCSLDIADNQIQVAHQADEEATQVLDFLANAETPGDYALALADETLGASLAGEITRRGGIAFLPEGRKLASEEAAKIALEWENWQTGGDLRVLRNLLQWPHFHRWLAGEARLFPSQLLTACDSLITDPLCETLAQASDFLGSARVPPAVSGVPPETIPPPNAVALLSALEKHRSTPFTTILETAKSEAAQRVLDLWSQISHSPLFADWPDGRLPALSRAFRTENIFTTTAPTGSVELSGWLETPWMEASRLAICGCVEGKLPTSIGEHPFLPDSKRAALGLQDNTRRLARDAYLVSCLLARHTRENLRFTFSRFDIEGSPTLPSRLLLRTDALPERVTQLFTAVPGNRCQPPRSNGWRWSLPDVLRVPPKTKISPSQCKDYLACPTRFYWKNILHLDTYEADPREIDARRFGSLIHKAVEMFGRRAADESKEHLIEKIVLEELENESLRLFGPSPTAAVRVQLESAQVRLRAFARVQAAEYAAGWRILEVEKSIKPELGYHLTIGPLHLSAQVDRIEQHPDFGYRILDYKTFSSDDSPEKKHFGRANPGHFLPESQVLVRGKEKTWLELQLPIYRSIAEQLYSTTNIQTSYFLLPADPSETKILPLELEDDTYQSALICAAAIARRISLGQFWPPQEHLTPYADSLGGLFLNGAPEDCFTPDTITFLKGQP